MRAGDRVYVAGHCGLVGSAIVRCLRARGFTRILTATHAELDLTRQQETEAFFLRHRPDCVFLAAARVGGIQANNTCRADFIAENLAIAVNVITAARAAGVRKLLNLGSSCIYPRNAPQPLREEYLLTGPLEPTNEPYAIAKIAAIKLCGACNDQYGTDFMSVMPSNLYGPGDTFDLTTSHVLPALVRKFHLSRLVAAGDAQALERDVARFGPVPEDFLGALRCTGTITLWGSGTALREFLFVDDLAAACLLLMEKSSAAQLGEFINIGSGTDVTVRDLAALVQEVVGSRAPVAWDAARPDGTPRKLLDTSRITVLGWHPQVDLRTGLQRCYEWYCRETAAR